MIARQWLVAALTTLVVPGVLAAQSLADRVAKARDGVVRMEFKARPGVCGNGHSINTGNDDDDDGCPCGGTVRVALSVSGGTVTGIKTSVGGRWGAGPAEELGQVGAAAAADYFLTLAERAPGEVGKRAILPAALADSAVVWPRLLGIARDERADRERRREATFWVGQAAEAAATQGLDTLATDETGDREVREAAIFALSQRPKDEGIPALIQIAKTNRDPDLRKKALFWLGQSADPRALKVFEDILGS
ncbi:MAG TPA: HEAT repeat domain-containing protein [Gemmatimonadales bacterium]|nr:HEAT repeat domain-containing protein [Gemmatimonadales bacterium]